MKTCPACGDNRVNHNGLVCDTCEPAISHDMAVAQAYSALREIRRRELSKLETFHTERRQ